MRSNESAGWRDMNVGKGEGVGQEVKEGGGGPQRR